MKRLVNDLIPLRYFMPGRQKESGKDTVATSFTLFHAKSASYKNPWLGVSISLCGILLVLVSILENLGLSLFKL